jgi:release factor glutamine methyltransferase
VTVAEAVAAVEERLRRAGVEAARLEAQVLAAHALQVERPWVLAHAHDPFERWDELDTLAKRRESREPLAYITGWREFYGRRFAVTRDVLIPRQETETLVEAALAEEHVKDVLDVGTGSGCIAITLASERPDWTVTAVDVSEAALAIARHNVESLPSPEPPDPRTPERTRTNPNEPELLRSNLFSALDGRTFDLIVSNPPYVAEADPLPPEVRDYEPHEALYAGPDGLEVYRRLAEEAHAFLRPSGALIVEVGDGQSEAVQRVFEEHGWHVERVVKDLSGTDRVLVARPLIA